MTDTTVPTIASEWDQLENTYRANFYNGAAPEGSARVVSPSSAILLVAAHSLNHYRHGRVKWADRWTGGLCELLPRLAPCSSIIADGPIPSWNNWEDRSDSFANLLTLARPRLAVDIHGMADTHGLDLCIGLGPQPNEATYAYAEQLGENFRSAGFSTNINDPFNAAPSFTVTAFEQARGITGLQLEIRAGLRDPAGKPREAAEFASAFANAITKLATDAKP